MNFQNSVDIALGYDRLNGEVMIVVNGEKLDDEFLKEGGDNSIDISEEYFEIVDCQNYIEIECDFYQYSRRFRQLIVQSVPPLNSYVFSLTDVSKEIIKNCTISDYECLSMINKDWYQYVKTIFIEEFGSDVLKIEKSINFPKLYYKLRLSESNHNDCLSYGLDKYIMNYKDGDTSFSSFCVMETIRLDFKSTFINFLKVSGYYGLLVTIEGILTYERWVPIESLLEYMEILFEYGSNDTEDILYRWSYLAASAFYNSYQVFNLILENYHKKGILGIKIVDLLHVLLFHKSEFEDKIIATIKKIPMDCMTEVYRIENMPFFGTRITSLFHMTILKSNFEYVKLMVQQGAIINSTDSNLDTPLHYAYRINNIQIADYLILNGADIDAVNSRHYCVLSKVIQYHIIDKDIDEIILEKYFFKSKSYEAFIFYSRKYPGLYEKQLEMKVRGMTLFLASVSNGQLKISERLLDIGFNINEINEITGESALHISVRRGDLEMVNYYLENAPHLLYSKNNYNQNPLHYAARNPNCLDVLKLLLKRDISKLMVEDKDRFTPFLLACKNGSTNLIETFLNYSKCDFRKHGNSEGTTGLMLAASHHRTSIFKLLLESGFNPFFKDKMGQNCFWYAVKGESYGIIKEILAKYEFKLLLSMKPHISNELIHYVKKNSIRKLFQKSTTDSKQYIINSDVL